ncbi:MAG: HlyD family type I secretion periplasmic adaptor subunit [Rhizobiaceae bacterium]
MTDAEKGIVKSIRWHLWGAGLFLCALLSFVVTWAAYLDISGAVVAQGTIVVESHVKKVNHKEGGIVDEIYVRDGDSVTKGDLLVRLVDSEASANIAIVNNQLLNLWAQRARLISDRNGDEIASFPDELQQSLIAADGQKIITVQQQLFDANRAGLASRNLQLEEQIKQLESQVVGIKLQITAKSEEIAFVELELPGLERLLEQQLIAAGKVLAARRERSRLKGEHGALVSQAAGAGMAISEKRVQILQLYEDRRAVILSQLEETEKEIARLLEQRAALSDRLARMEIRSPRSGLVHQLNVHTRGAVVTPAEPILHIVPNKDQLIVESQIAPTDIDQVHLKQSATIRFPGLNQRKTPELTASITAISAGTLQDQLTGLHHFTVRLNLDKEQVKRLDKIQLLPGMPVETLIKTGDRSILSYVIKPLTDHLSRALNEE